MQDQTILKKSSTHTVPRETTTSATTVDPIEMKRLQLEREAARLKQVSAPKAEEKYYLSDAELLRREMEVHMEEGEEEFRDEFMLVDRVYPWASQYSPRKPKYFNRVWKGRVFFYLLKNCDKFALKKVMENLFEFLTP